MNKRTGQPEASPLTKTERAYLAGIIDGEGSIGIYARKKGGPNYFLKLVVRATVVMTNDPPHQRPSWAWTVYGKNALRVLQIVKPYMLIKAKQVELAEQFMNELVDNRAIGHRKIVPPKQIARREWFYEQMASLNRPHQFRKKRVVAAAETK